ncbi:MAG: hypothetical protein ACT4QF_11410 [Sporichthyaceae bacterium]
MNRSLVAGILSLALLPGLAACGAGFDAETQFVEADNANAEVNGIVARAIVLVKGKQASSAALAGTLINRSDKNDVLTTVALTDANPGATTITLTPNTPLAAGQLLPLGTGTFKPITVPDARTIKVGNYVNVVMTFREAGPLRLQVVTEDRTNYYEDVTPEGATAPTGQAKQKIETVKTTPAKATPAKTEAPAKAGANKPAAARTPAKPAADRPAAAKP